MSYYKDFFESIKIKEETMKGTICIEGVVGVGKTTLGRLIADRYGVNLYEEPVVNNPILDKFYHDKNRWSFTSQIFFLNKRFKMIKDASKKNACVLDRSIYGDVIFSKMLVHDGFMTQKEFDIYEELLYNMLEHVEKPRLMIYLETSVDCAVAKIKKRGRDYEQIVPRQYWENLDKNYREYFKHYNLSDLIVINVDNRDFLNNPEDREYVFELLDKKLK